MAFKKLCEFLETQNWDEALDYCERESRSNAKAFEWHLYQGVIAEEKKDQKSAGEFYKKAYLINQDTQQHAIFLKVIYLYLFELEKTPNRLKKLKFVSCLNPQDQDLLKFIAENESAYSQLSCPDVVLFTGTLGRKSFFPETLNQEGLGGSETAFIIMAKKLRQRGVKVVCFCNTDVAKTYDDVPYFPILDFYAFEYVHHYPLFISSRFLYPIVQSQIENHKVLWLHDLGTTLQEDLSPHLSKVEKIMVLSDYQKEDLQRRFDVEEGKFFKTRNGFLPELFNQYTESKETSNVSLKLIYMSRPERGLVEAVQVFEKLKLVYSTLELHVCTYTNQKTFDEDPQIAAVIETLKKPGIIFHGSLKKEELYQLLSRCQVLLYPNITLSETSCITAIEAMACGVPIVTSDRGALKETVGDAGIVIPYVENKADFVSSLAQAVAECFNPEVWNRLSQLGKKRAWNHYLWDQIADEWVELFKKEKWVPRIS
ncbi:MAG: glycosyltransferase family 4 protein [Deltaproteobacteria bacterium]|nr:MAG: glycosyltransferase family 4 protein [Deltaproteobacteria bacterium]